VSCYKVDTWADLQEGKVFLLPAPQTALRNQLPICGDLNRINKAMVL